MNPGELIKMMLVAGVAIIVLGIVWSIFRKKKKIALIVTILSVFAFVLFFSLRPFFIQQQHAERYAILAEYLHKQYPEYEFDISPEVLEDGYRPYEYRVVANGYKYRNEYYRVDQDGSVEFASYSTVDYGYEEDLDYLLLNSVYEQPFEYIEGNVRFEEISRYEQDAFLVRLMRVNNETILFNYLKIDGKYFLEQVNYLNEKNCIELNISPKHYENYYVLATLPGFAVEHWKKVNEQSAKIEFKVHPPAIYVVPN